MPYVDRRSAAAFLIAGACLVAGCGQNPATPTPTVASAQPTPVVSQAELQVWIRFRLVYGLRTDVEWVVAIATNPAASSAGYHVPMLPFELQLVDKANLSGAALLPAARGYADDFPEFAGAWLELPRVVLAFTGMLTERRAEVEAFFSDKVIVREVQFTLAELQGFMAAVVADEAWFSSVGGEVVDIGIDQAMNSVSVHIRSPDEVIERQARERFSDTGWMQFTYDGPGPWKGPVGNLEVTVVDRNGKPAAVACLIGSTDPRVQAETSMFAPDGKCFFQDLAAVKWGLRVTYDFGGDSQIVLADYLVPAAGVERATVVVGP